MSDCRPMFLNCTEHVQKHCGKFTRQQRHRQLGQQRQQQQQQQQQHAGGSDGTKFGLMSPQLEPKNILSFRFSPSISGAKTARL